MSEAKLPLHELDRSTVRSILSFASAMVGFAAVMGANAMMKRPLWRRLFFHSVFILMIRN